MKKANVLLTSLILTIALILLGIFGCDMAYVILSRYKLQKVTESIAAECVSALARPINNTGRTDADIHNIIREITNQYLEVYRTRSSDINRFWINRIEYKRSNDPNNGAFVRVSTEASVYPAFLRFVGTRGIIVYAISYAKTERETLEQRINIQSEGIHFTEFDLSNSTDAPIITHKPRGEGDFAINFKYEPFTDSFGRIYSQNGGYFIFGGYKSINPADDEYYWTDIGYGAIDNDPSHLINNYIVTIDDNPSHFCINNTNGESIGFDLNTDNKDGEGGAEELRGFTKKVDKIRVYHSLGVPQTTYYPGIPFNPCNSDCPLPAFVCNTLRINEYMQNYTNRDATVTLTILNNVTIISKQNYQSSAGSETICIPERSPNSNVAVECRPR